MKKEILSKAIIDCIFHIDSRFRNIYTYTDDKKEYLSRARTEYCFMVNLWNGLKFLYSNPSDIISVKKNNYGLISLNIPFTMKDDSEDI